MSYNDSRYGQQQYGNGDRSGYNGNRRRGNRNEYDDRRRGGNYGGGDREPQPETIEQRLRNVIVKFADEQPPEPTFPPPFERLAGLLHENASNVAAIADAFRIAVTELPFKTPFYASLLARLYAPNPKAAETDQVGLPLGRLVLEEFWKGFQALVDKLSWLELRLSIHFFAHLALLRLVSSESLVALFKSFAAVLDEPGVSYTRGSQAAFCVGEGILRAWPILHESYASDVDTIVSAIAAFADSATIEKQLAQPYVRLHEPGFTPASTTAVDLLESLVVALRELPATTTASILRNLNDEVTLDVPPFELPSFLVPPEIIDMDSFSGGADAAANDKKEELPVYLLRLFDNTITPDPHTPNGYILRTTIMQIANIFEINRRECARLLMELPKWFGSGTFKSKEAAVKPDDAAGAIAEPPTGPNWQLENTLIETILSLAFRLPGSTHKTLYYSGLITELCKLSPQTVGPAVGKSIRKLYSELGNGLDVDAARRFVEWFATHMSNFGFAWVWKEWVGDLELPTSHPKRAFMNRAVELEIRLAYYDRVAKALPEQFKPVEVGVLAAEAPGANYEFDDPTHPHHDVAQQILNLLRDRTKAELVIAELDGIRNTLQEAGDPRPDAVVCSATLQALLQVGSRSFSHLLNAIERYLPVLRSLVAPGSDARADILRATGSFWARSGQMVGIVLDKLMQYQIVEPADVVSFAFGEAQDAQGHVQRWELVRSALDKARGRLVVAQRKAAALRKEEEDAKAKKLAGTGAAMDVDGADGIETDAPLVAKGDEDVSEDVKKAIKACEMLARDERAALSRALGCFVERLTAPQASRAVLQASSWENREGWGGPEWDTWILWGWYRHFCRTYATQLRANSTTMSTIAFQTLATADSDPVAAYIRRTWSVAVEGGEP